MNRRPENEAVDLYKPIQVLDYDEWVDAKIVYHIYPGGAIALWIQYDGMHAARVVEPIVDDCVRNKPNDVG